MANLIIRFKDGTPSEEIVALRERFNGRQIKRFDKLKMFRVIEFDDAVTADAMRAYSESEHVEIASYEATYSWGIVPNDAEYPNQWHHASQYMDSENAWDVETGDSAVKVFHVDSGVCDNFDLPILRGVDQTRVVWLPGCDVRDIENPADGGTDPVGHGSATVSVLGATGNDGVGSAGMDWGCTIYSVQIALSGPSYAAGIEFAVDNGADIITASVAGPEYDPLLEAAIERAYEEGVVVVICTGNDTSDFTDYPGQQPATHRGAIGVGSIGTTHQRSSFSNYGGGVQLTAPGEGIVYSALLKMVQQYSGYWNTGDGTSFSCPLAAGVFSLVKAAHPTADREELIARVRGTADSPRTANQTWDDELGFGTPKAAAAIAMTYTPYTLSPPASVTAAWNGSVVDVSWPSVTGARAYRIYRDYPLSSCLTYTGQLASAEALVGTVAHVGGGTETFTDEDTTTGITYTYRIMAMDEQVDSDYSTTGVAESTHAQGSGDTLAAGAGELIEGQLLEFDFRFLADSAYGSGDTTASGGGLVHGTGATGSADTLASGSGLASSPMATGSGNTRVAAEGVASASAPWGWVYRSFDFRFLAIVQEEDPEHWPKGIARPRRARRGGSSGTGDGRGNSARASHNKVGGSVS